MDIGFNTDTVTTNRLHYKAGSCLPPIKFHQVPAIQLKDALKLQPRNFPIEPMGPNRHWEKFDHNNLPNITPFTEKPIVRAPPPNKVVVQVESPQKRADRTTRDVRQTKTGHGRTVWDDRKDGPFRPDEQGYTTKQVPRETIEDLCHSLCWSTTTGKATKEACLPTTKVTPPTTTLEENADIPMRRPKRYESRPSLWQQIAPIWDKLQDRSHVGENVGKVGTREKVLTKESDTFRHQNPAIGDLLTPADNEIITKLCREKALSLTYVRQCPGYDGFVPLSPLAIPIAVKNKSPNLCMMSTMQASYRPIPLNGTMNYAHKGPLSRTVTLTFPYNPYNKVENRAFFRKDIEHPW
ncbi:uncharacterized protein [Amphiura filiformis]|uniref:uncharacterized protein n=1 Tax=Amphiura filiformis TaxID=82378 RepID=UPI003B226632